MDIHSLSALVAQEAQLLPTEATKATQVVFNKIAEALNNNEQVNIRGFGVFQAQDRLARTARNPRTGEVISVAFKRVPKFKASARLRADVNARALANGGRSE